MGGRISFSLLFGALAIFLLCVSADDAGKIGGKISHPKAAVQPVKREAATITAVAAVTVGLTTAAMQTLGPQNYPHMNSGCEWSGTAPFCTGDCDSDQTRHRTSAQFVEGKSGYGKSCWLGRKFYCCRKNERDQSWSGTWQSAMTGDRYHCQFHVNKRLSVDPLVIYRDCGELHCNVQTPTKYIIERTEIGGLHCDEVNIFGMTGHAIFGRITFLNGTVPIDFWYKK